MRRDVENAVKSIMKRQIAKQKNKGVMVVEIMNAVIKYVEYRYQEEILAIQSKEHVTRGQARAIFGENNPYFRKMNFSEATRADLQGEAKKIQGRSVINASKEVPPGSERQVSAGSKAVTTQVVCMSPGSGQLFTTKVNLRSETPMRTEGKGDTSETRAEVDRRGEVFFYSKDDIAGEQCDSREKDDIENYEDELKKANTLHK